jgi:hypothetical protein
MCVEEGAWAEDPPQSGWDQREPAALRLLAQWAERHQLELPERGLWALLWWLELAWGKVGVAEEELRRAWSMLARQTPLCLSFPGAGPLKVFGQDELWISEPEDNGRNSLGAVSRDRAEQIRAAARAASEACPA